MNYDKLPDTEFKRNLEILLYQGKKVTFSKQPKQMIQIEIFNPIEEGKQLDTFAADTFMTPSLRMSAELLKDYADGSDMVTLQLNDDGYFTVIDGQEQLDLGEQ